MVLCLLAVASPAGASPGYGAGVIARSSAFTSFNDPALIDAPAGVLIDSADGRVLWQKNANERMAPASTTKIMTALVVLKNADLTSSVAVSAAAELIGQGLGPEDAAEVNLVAGEQQPLTELLYALMLESANDAAVALAQHVSGSVEGFVQMMNAEATRLGATGTKFANPHGLDDADHYSTASDLALFARVAMQDSTFRTLVNTEEHLFPGFGARPPRTLRNRNRLLHEMPGVDGVKTGTTRAAGRCLVISAREGEELRIGVVLGAAGDAAPDATKLLSYGFRSFRREAVLQAGRSWGSATYGDGSTEEIIPATDLSMLVLESSPPHISYESPARLRVSDVTGFHSVVDATRRCASQPCRPPSKSARALEIFWSLAAPLARILDPAA